MLFSYCDQQIVSNGIFLQIPCTGIYLGCSDVPALINRDKHPIIWEICILTPPLIP